MMDLPPELQRATAAALRLTRSLATQGIFYLPSQGQFYQLRVRARDPVVRAHPVDVLEFFVAQGGVRQSDGSVTLSA